MKIKFNTYTKLWYTYSSDIFKSLPYETRPEGSEEICSKHIWIWSSLNFIIKLILICYYGCIQITHSWSWSLLEKLPIVQPLKNFPAFHGTRRLITAFTRALHWSLSWARSSHFITSHPIVTCIQISKLIKYCIYNPIRLNPLNATVEQFISFIISVTGKRGKESIRNFLYVFRINVLDRKRKHNFA
jgi:hypothetical protein